MFSREVWVSVCLLCVVAGGVAGRWVARPPRPEASCLGLSGLGSAVAGPPPNTLSAGRRRAGSGGFRLRQCLNSCELAVLPEKTNLLSRLPGTGRAGSSSSRIVVVVAVVVVVVVVVVAVAVAVVVVVVVILVNSTPAWVESA